jgi:hypothetical protein
MNPVISELISLLGVDRVLTKPEDIIPYPLPLLAEAIRKENGMELKKLTQIYENRLS